jgi:hypothetical protein
MTNQELFDFVVGKLREQNKKSIDPEIMREDKPLCMYRAPDGCRCAAGWLIPDDKYNRHMEGKRIETVIEAYKPFKLDLREPRQLMLISDLQRVHDNFEVSDWERGFQNAAHSYSLTYTPKVN